MKLDQEPTALISKALSVDKRGLLKNIPPSQLSGLSERTLSHFESQDPIRMVNPDARFVIFWVGLTMSGKTTLAGQFISEIQEKFIDRYQIPLNTFYHHLFEAKTFVQRRGDVASTTLDHRGHLISSDNSASVVDYAQTHLPCPHVILNEQVYSTAASLPDGTIVGTQRGLLRHMGRIVREGRGAIAIVHTSETQRIKNMEKRTNLKDAPKERIRRREMRAGIVNTRQKPEDIRRSYEHAGDKDAKLAGDRDITIAAFELLSRVSPHSIPQSLEDFQRLYQKSPDEWAQVIRYQYLPSWAEQIAGSRFNDSVFFLDNPPQDPDERRYYDGKLLDECSLPQALINHSQIPGNEYMKRQLQAFGIIP